MSENKSIAKGYDKNPAASLSLLADAYTESSWFESDTRHILGRSWQWVCHSEKTRTPGSYVTTEIAGHITYYQEKAQRL